MSERKTIYASLNVCQCNFQNKPLQIQKQLNNLGDSTNIFLNIYLPANSAFVSEMNDLIYSKKRPFYVPNIPTITLGINYGVIAFLFKKEAEGKSIERATTETALEFTTSYFGGMGGKALATRVATKFSITMAGRMLGGYAGSLVPIAGTIVGAVAGGWIAGKIEEWWFSDEEQALAEAKAENERIRKLEEAYFLKINRIINYLITHQYIELRVLNEDEAEKLCKEISDINSAYFKTILLMLSFPYYLDKDEQSYKEAQEKNPTIIRIQPIANKAVKNYIDDFMEGAYDNLDPENYEVAFEEDTGIPYDEADEDEFEDWFIKNVLYHDDLSEIYKILKSLVKD